MTGPVKVTEADLRSAAAYNRSVRAQLHNAEINLDVAQNLLDAEKAALAELEAEPEEARDATTIEELDKAVKAYETGVRENKRIIRNAQVSLAAVKRKYSSDRDQTSIAEHERDLEHHEDLERRAHNAELDAKIASAKAAKA